MQTATLTNQRQPLNPTALFPFSRAAKPARKWATREEELFYAPANIARLEKIFADMEAGDKVYHDLIEVDDDA
jgi:hypothetical protein